MSYRKKLLLFNNFIQNLDMDIQTQIEDYVGSNYGMDEAQIISYFGLERQFMDYMDDNAA